MPSYIKADNSQSASTALQPSVSPALIIQDKKDTSDSSSIDENASVNISSDNALLPATSQAGVSNGTDNADSSPEDVSVYVIRKDDSLAQIANMFNVSVNTILWANDMKKGDKLVEGDTLIILPVSGVKVTVAKGQTLKNIATKYNVDVSDIAGFNGIAEDAKLAVGDELIVPDGVVNDGDGDQPAPKSTTQDTTDYYIKHPAKDLGNYWINPVPGYKYKSQGLHDGNAVDLAAATGTPILAAAAGTVIFAHLGYNGGYGNLVIIQHPNGVRTLYAHQSKIVTHLGDIVSQGEKIGEVGSTGHSTGPHLHFGVIGARNFANDL